MDVELHELDRRHEDLRIHDDPRRRRLLASVAEIGQQVPVVVILEEQKLVLIDGYLRVEALQRLGRDTVATTTWQLSEAEALLMHRHLAASSPSALEDAWLLSRLRLHGLSLDDLGRRLCRSKSWVSRRLALLDELVASAQARVRDGTVPAYAAMKYLVPLARANRGQCELLLAGLGTTPVSSRELEALYTAWRRADTVGRQRIVAEPRLFLRTLAAASAPCDDGDDSAALLKDLGSLAAIAWRARRRVHHLGPWTAEHTRAWRNASDSIATLRAAVEERDAGPDHPREHPDPA